jgi:hypothetical protein
LWFGYFSDSLNNREPLFRRWQATAILCRVLGKAHGRFAFELRGFALVEERLSFYIKPADELQLPTIMGVSRETIHLQYRGDQGGT